jgi:hypothetical protein
MDNYERAHLDYAGVMQSFAAHRAEDRRTTASLLADIAEIDAQHHYLRAGFESMRAFCMAELHLTEDAASKRIQVARLARDLPALFPALADGRLHAKAVRTLASHLTAANVEEWIAAAANKSVGEIEVLIAHRYPQPEILRLDDGIYPEVVAPQRSNVIEHAPGHVQNETPLPQPKAPTVRTKIAPLSQERCSLTTSILVETRDVIREVQDLLGHTVDVPQIIHLGVVKYRDQLVGRKFGTTERPAKPRPTGTRRAIPAHVRRKVYERDGRSCAFIDEASNRCGSTNHLEFDHVVPVARGGRSTAENLRLVCRAHNQYEAERAFGRKFIEEKKQARAAGASPTSRPFDRAAPACDRRRGS